MGKHSAADIRTVCIVGHGDSGKTTLADNLLHKAGAVSRLGSVKDKTSVFDFDDLEKEKQHSIDSAVAHCEFDGKLLQLIDTPGYPDYVGEAIGAISASDGVVICINAVNGVQVNTPNGWRGYVRLWKAHHDEPSQKSVRRFLGLPLEGSIDPVPRRGRSAPRWLGWRLGSYVQIDTPHFTIFSRADSDASRELAVDMERCYWAWTQVFFPLWEGAGQVSAMIGDVEDDVDLAEHLESNRDRIVVRRKMRVVLFHDANEYRQTLGPSIPGIERSTGFYHDDKQTTFLYAAEVPDRATRRHELVHQLFREATRSSLGRRMPAERSEFWLIEGIAGYFESMQMSESLATVGGWDASRLQFARHRVFVGGDIMPMEELAADGRIAAQKRQDIARWYAHAIAQTHHLMDRGDAESRQWVYQKLAELYEIRYDTPKVERPENVDRDLKAFLRIDDRHLRRNVIDRELTQLCLAGCEVSPRGLALIPSTSQIRWLDLSGSPVAAEDVMRLAPESKKLRQLSLEATRIDGTIAGWLSDSEDLRELDLSFTGVDDSIMPAIAAGDTIDTLWLTGTQITDESIDAIGGIKSLRYVDMQRTGVTSTGLDRLKKLRPNLEINPLKLHSP